ncbi:Bifunctional protein putA [Pluralibacter gergoviae]|nr:Bifunctional protein putA [Pluralibacter gergoviae]
MAWKAIRSTPARFIPTSPTSPALKKLLAAPNLIYPQFATHNAHTLAAIYQLAGQNYYPGQYEFQCLHGMANRCMTRWSAKFPTASSTAPAVSTPPVGTHETLLAYLVRRLLENGGQHLLR